MIGIPILYLHLSPVRAVGLDLEVPADVEVVDATGKLVIPGSLHAYCLTVSKAEMQPILSCLT